MANQQQVQSLSYEAGADLSAEQFRIMKLSSGQVVRVTASSDASVGVLQTNPSAQGEAAEVAYAGIIKIISGAATAIDSLIMSDTQGRAILATGAGNRVIGQAKTATAAAGELIEVQLGSAGYTL